jgi:hypothetical protein
MLIPFGILSAAAGVEVAGDYELIATAFGTGSSGEIVFNSIPSGYKHLQIRMLVRDTSATTDNSGTVFRFNSDSGSNYARHRLRGDGSAVSSSAATSQTSINIFTAAVGGGATANAFGAAVIDVLDAFSTTKNKTVRALTGFHVSAGRAVEINSGLFMSTSAVASISIGVGTGGSWTTGSRFSLYGIRG